MSEYILKDGKPEKEICGTFLNGGFWIADDCSKEEYKKALGYVLKALSENLATKDKN